MPITSTTMKAATNDVAVISKSAISKFSGARTIADSNSMHGERIASANSALRSVN